MALPCGGVPFSVTLSIVFDSSFSVYRFRFIVFVEDNTAAAAAAGGCPPLRNSRVSSSDAIVKTSSVLLFHLFMFSLVFMFSNSFVESTG